jgi:copper chaperone NosL
MQVLLAMLVALTATSIGMAFDTDQAPVPDSSHKCPVCGMLVHRYPYFVASVTYDDGHTVFFDGVKDMFKYLFNLTKYDPGRHREAIVAVRVTEYYDMRPIDGRKAFYVLGSDVLGPMGHELIPLENIEDARLFLKDHHGRRVLAFDQISPASIKQLD